MALQNVLIDGRWRASASAGTFKADNPATMAPANADEYPISSWADCDAALTAAASAAVALRNVPANQLAAFLERLRSANRGRGRRARCPGSRGKRAAGAAALGRSGASAHDKPIAPGGRRGTRGDLATAHDRHQGRHSFGSRAAGADLGLRTEQFPLRVQQRGRRRFCGRHCGRQPGDRQGQHVSPGTSRLLAELAFAAVQHTALPPATVQLLYRTGHEDGARAVADARTGAVGYTGSRRAGLTLKAAADAAGKPIYVELSSINPVLILPGALAERSADLVNEFVTSALMGCGQFCTNPGLTLLIAGEPTEDFIRAVAERFKAAPAGTLLSRSVATSLSSSLQTLRGAGAKVVVGGEPGGGVGYSFSNTLLRATAAQFLAEPEAFQTEAFGNVSLLVVADDEKQLARVIEAMEGNLTGTIYSDRQGADDAAYDRLAPALRTKVGRLLNDRMPTGVAVSSAMNHGGPYPATGHPGFTAVGIPASLRRFAALECYDQVRSHRLPPLLQNANPLGAWRLIDGSWTQAPCA